MAQIILSESSNMANSLFGEIQSPIAAFIERRDEAWMHDESNIAAKIFKQVRSTHHSEAFTGIGAVDTFAPVGENGAYPTGGVDMSDSDGKKLFAADHKPQKKSTTQCNAFKDAFSAAALGKLATAMQNLTDDDGNMLTMNPDTIIIPNDAEIKAEVFGVLGAHNDPGTAASNKFNYLFGAWNVLIWNELNQYCTGGTTVPWILMDSGYNKRYFGAVDIMRKDLTVKSEIAHNDANVWKGRARFTGGFVDFRAFAAGGLSFGNTL